MKKHILFFFLMAAFSSISINNYVAAQTQVAASKENNKQQLEKQINFITETLSLSKTDVEKLRKAMEDFSNGQEAFEQKLNALKTEEEKQSLRKERKEAYDKALKSVLSEEQIKQLKQASREARKKPAKEPNAK